LIDEGIGTASVVIWIDEWPVRFDLLGKNQKGAYD
jgi:hypothetical protein